MSCSVGSASSGLTNAVGIAESVVRGFEVEAPILNQLLPKLLPTPLLEQLMNPGKTGWLDLAQADLDGLRAEIAKGISDASGAAILDKVFNYLNITMQDLAPILTMLSTTNPEISGAVMIIRDIALVLPLIENFIVSVIPPTAPTPPKAASRLASRRAKAIPNNGKPLPSADEALVDLRMRLRR